MPLFGPPDIQKLRDKRKVKKLIKIVGSHKQSEINVAAAKALGNICDPQSIDPLVHALTSTNTDLRKVAAEALGRIGDSRAVQPLIDALTDRNIDVKETVVEALGMIGDSRAVEPLVSLIKDPVRRVQKVAAEALGRIGDLRAVQPLIDALTDRNIDVKETVVEALEAMGWQPDQGAAGAAYWAVKDEYDKCVDIGKSALKPLLDILTHRLKDPILKHYDQHHWVVFTKIGGPEAKETLHSYLRYLKKKNEEYNKEWGKYSQLPKDRTRYEHYRDLVAFLVHQIGNVEAALRSFPD